MDDVRIDEKKLDWFSRSINWIMLGIVALTITFVGIVWYNDTHYTYLGTYDTEYVGKYTSTEPIKGKLGSQNTVYNVIFKKLDKDSETMELVRVTVPFKFYNSTDSITGLLTMRFYETKDGGMRIGWENGYLAVFNYNPTNLENGVVIKGTDFKERMYEPVVSN